MFKINIQSIVLFAAALSFTGACTEEESVGLDGLAELEDVEERSASCQAACGDQLDMCEMQCEGSYHPYYDEAQFNWCVDQCFDDYDTCANEDFAYSQPTGQICHLDLDTHWFDVDIEFYTVDAWSDHSCAGQQDHYKKRYLGKVSCSHFTSLFDSSTCANRVANKAAQLAGQGYTMVVADVDQDMCPHPRI
ncbi:hypothetical protein PPSIR1_12023 [Plesiocystis pacifica SIR-1]|uniref:Uncharacterized protein n=1 Tax=Plesiocystis pacifica SIR-1 TaxID=391625 RepID=A6G5T4_9BACT|nr:hypothetical protein [Plesiocystis pacifica]EDM78708.1 hypothetical protein PPSIR1_12023 [Plesiocystis pacifica SIR-1]